MKTFKTGDKVFSIQEGWVTLSASDDPIYPLESNGDSFTIDGKRYNSDAYPSLFTYNPLEQSQFPKLMEVIDDNGKWEKRWVIADLTGLSSDPYKIIISKSNPDKDFNAKNKSWITVKEAREIQPTEEVTILTIDQIAEKFGLSADKIQIKS